MRLRVVPLELRVATLALGAAALPAALALLLTETSLPRWATYTLTALALAGAAAVALVIYRRLVGGFERLTGLIHSLRGGEFTLRARSEAGSFGRSLAAVNVLAQDLSGLQRAGIESDALLGKLLGSLDLAILVFDDGDRVTGANEAANRIFASQFRSLPGSHASDLGLSEWMSATAPVRASRRFPGGEGPWEIRVVRFRRSGKPHRLLVITNLAQALREEERRAWQGLIRVLTHETGNSLGPIRCTAYALNQRLSRIAMDESTSTALNSGLDLIERRARMLSEFIHRYADLARLPPPQPHRINLDELIQRVVSLETRLDVEAVGRTSVMVVADPAQLEQALINLLKNAADAALQTDGGVQIRWSESDEGTVIEVLDGGPGLPQTENLFLPFFTTKPSGSGIGLVLTRQIIEAHGGTLTLTNRTGTRGAIARIQLRTNQRTS